MHDIYIYTTKEYVLLDFKDIIFPKLQHPF